MRDKVRFLGVCAVMFVSGCAHPGPAPSDRKVAHTEQARNPINTRPTPAIETPGTSTELPGSEVGAGEETPGPTTGEAPMPATAPTIVTAIPKPSRADVRKQLRTHWPDLRLACGGRHACVQSGDLDGDDKPDIVAIVGRGSELGVVIFSTSAGTLRLGAGEQIALPAEDWELDASGSRVWTSEGTQTVESDWRNLQGIWISPANHRTACARAMALGHDALVYSGSDAAEAIIIREAGFCWVPCGY